MTRQTIWKTASGLAAAAAFAAAECGLWSLVYAGAKRVPGPEFLWITLLTALCGAIGFLIAGALRKSKALLQNLTCALAAALCGAAGYFYMTETCGFSWVGGAVSVVLFAAGSVIGSVFFSHRPGVLAIVGVGLGEIGLGAIFRLTDAGAGYSLRLFIWVFYFVSLTGTLSGSFQNIETHMTRRGHSTASLPPKVRKNTLTMLGILFIVGAALLLAGAPAGEFLRTFGAVLIQIVLFLFDLISALVSWLASSAAGDSMPSGKPGVAEVTEKLHKDNTEWLFWAAIVILAAAIIFLLIPRLWRKLREQIKKLRDFIRRQLLRREQNRTQSGSAGEYFDVAETVTEAQTPIQIAVDRRRWRKEVRETLNAPVGRARSTGLWCLAVRGLELTGTQVEPGDTPSDVEEKAGPLPGLRRAREDTEALVFDGRETLASTEPVEEVLETLKKKL